VEKITYILDTVTNLATATCRHEQLVFIITILLSIVRGQQLKNNQNKFIWEEGGGGVQDFQRVFF